VKVERFWIMATINLEELMHFCRRKGFVYSGSEIYGGLANTWDYGPKGVMLKNNIKQAWREHFVTSRTDMVEIDAGILMNQKVWEASGHTAGFSDCLVDDKKTKHRFRADHLIEDQLGIDVEGKTATEITKIIKENNLKNPINNKEADWTDARYMNLMFETNRDKINHPATLLNELLAKYKEEKIEISEAELEELKAKIESQENGRIYLRPETAQGIFVQFKNVLLSERKKLPFGIGQVGKAFRNEITPGNFIFRIVELEQMEIEYFIDKPKTDEEWNKVFEAWLNSQHEFLTQKLGFDPANIRDKEHAAEKLSHYSKRTVDIEFKFPFGWGELTGLAYRTDFDLNQHQKYSGKDMNYMDTQTGEKFIPHVMEPTVGVDRLFLSTLCQFYVEEKLEENGKEDVRTVLKLPYNLAPFKLAILPLMKKDGLAEKAEEILVNLKKQNMSVDYDEAGSIGKRYRRQDENGTPFCVTADYQTLEDGTVTLRNRDDMSQIRVKIEELSEEFLMGKI
jgi:glycyl-tRNA synthetase